MKQHLLTHAYHVEILPPKQETEKLYEDLDRFADKYRRVMDSGFCACLTDNAMGNLAFQGIEVIEEMELSVHENQVMIHLNTFHTRDDLHRILDSCTACGIRQLLVVTGDGSDRLPRLTPADVAVEDVAAVTSVELLRYIERTFPGQFDLGVAFNPYEPQEHEFAKLERKLAAGATFVITQPVIERHPVVDRLMAEYPDLPVVVEAWMSKKLHLLSEAVGYDIPEDAPYDPVENLKTLHVNYPNSEVYLSILGFKTQYGLLQDIRRSAN